ncbi:MAG: OmpA family protein [Bacteroidota bacterium]
MQKSIILFLLFLFASQITFAQTEEDLEAWRRNVVIMNLAQINSEKDDYAPAFYDQGIVYPSSRRKNGPIDKSTGDTYHDLYYTPLESGGMRTRPQNFSLNLNSTTHEGPLSFNAKENKVYFSRSNKMRRTETLSYVKIYEAEKGKVDWENIKPMPFNRGEFSCMHPSISPTGDRLFFASDMPGGFGGMDLYVVEWLGTTWSRPMNLGPKINTAGQEAFPFIHDSGVLFFASNGHPSLGGFDIFLMNLGDPSEEIINLGLPFNSSEDDTGFILNEDGKNGYFSSNRSGGIGKDDIYSFRALEGIKTMASSFVLNSTVEVYNTDNQAGLPLSKVRVFEKDGDVLEENIYDHQYILNEQTGERYLQKVLKDESQIKKSERLTNRRGEIIHAFKSEQDYLILVTKAGFETVEFEYSTRGKIESERIEIPITPVTCFDLSGKVVTESYEPIPYAEVRVKNSCTGKEQVLTTNRQGEYVYCLEIGCDFDFSADRAGFSHYETLVSTKSIRGIRSKTLDVILNQEATSILNTPIRTGTTIVIDNIYYDFNAYSIQAGAAKGLDELASVMQRYPSMEIELISYTDARGEDYYNLELSQKRAQAAREYLIQKGIIAKRIKSFGFGEARIRNHCVDGVDCTDEEHAYNRRTEVKVIRINEEVEFRDN